TDNTPIYSVVAAVHPAMRYKYWSQQKWGTKYENNAKKAVRTVWKEQYSQEAEETENNPAELPLDAKDDDADLALLGMSNSSEVDQLEEFATSQRVKMMPLIYWKKNHGSYPQLA
ncbi:hypothetical protein BGZ73_002079, partial [Actinomortierella ambigua]